MISLKAEMKTLIAKLRVRALDAHDLLCVLFFFSGCAMLIYQIIWQRLLANVFGFDLKAVTIIISVFMFGLGVGALIGGWIADRFGIALLSVFVFIEFLLAGFGFVSIDIISLLASWSFKYNALFITLLSYLVFAIPTSLMGATFPILVKYANNSDRHIGYTVGTLYFVNSLGGALGAYAAGFILLYSMGLSGAINIAACINLCVAIVAYIFFRREE